MQLIHNGVIYNYVLNLQGDVHQIRRASDGIIVAVYDYNAWGEVLFSSGWMAGHNPLRYRGKYFDNSTGLYYLQSRFYDPMVGRFINADGLVSTGQGILGHNMFTYCLNNPANMVDHDGYRGTNLHSAATNAMATLMSQAAARARARTATQARGRTGTNLHSAATNRNVAARASTGSSWGIPLPRGAPAPHTLPNFGNAERYFGHLRPELTREEIMVAVDIGVAITGAAIPFIPGVNVVVGGVAAVVIGIYSIYRAGSSGNNTNSGCTCPCYCGAR